MLLICDIDGTIANCSHRVQRIPDWDAFHEGMADDPPILPMVNLARLFAFNQSGVGLTRYCSGLFFLTGRPHQYRIPTEQWIERECGLHVGDDYQLLMRPNDDWTPDAEMKSRLLDSALEPWGCIQKWGEGLGLTITNEWLRRHAIFLEDRDRVVEMWRGRGYCCLQPKEGEY